MKKKTRSELLKMIKDRTKETLPEDKELQRLEDIILDAVEPIIMREGNSENRMVMAGAIMKAAMIIYHGDLGNDGTAALLREVGAQVEEGLLDEFKQILEDSKQSNTVH
tara:strand:+ start:1162 stop:1488 length:327 start_codon:yes stop_codon:yes gene_type:complete